MPPKATKRVAAKPPTSKSARDAPPPPFEPASSLAAANPGLASLLDGLDTRFIYALHIDTLPADYKRRIFAIPVALNGIFLLLLLLRLYYAVPKYASIIGGALGGDTREAVDPATRASWRALAGVVARRVALFAGDWALFRVVGGWVWSFFVEGPENACTWRWKLGYRQRELVVRVSRRWGAEELFRGVKRGGESAYWKTKILPAVEEKWMAEKTGYLMMGRDWDLDFPAMVDGQRAIDGKEMDEGAVDGVLLGWNGSSDDDGEWAVARFREERQTPNEPPKEDPKAASKDEYGMTPAEGADQMTALRERLAGMGKETLFFRMIEIAQYEGSVPGRSPEQKERRALEEIEKMFEAGGVQFRSFMDEMGLEFPGMRKPA